MTLRRILVLAIVLLFFFLGMYTWNQRTGVMDKVATHVGLELVGGVLKPIIEIHSNITDIWENYFDLVGVREENVRLKVDILAMQSQLIAAGEHKAELQRLRALLSLPPDRSWRPVGARILAGRLGPNSVLETVILSRGYATGAAPGTPLMTNLGLVGRVLRASAHTSTALLLSDQGSRVAVFSQESRTAGILTGQGGRRDLEVRFVGHNAKIKNGELLVTSGLDGVYPKGLPVAIVTQVSVSGHTPFLQVEAKALVNPEHLEEVLLLEPTGIAPARDPLDPDFMGPPTEEQYDMMIKLQGPGVYITPVEEGSAMPLPTAPTTTAVQEEQDLGGE